jgi:glycine cleavage system regulatory protein
MKQFATVTVIGRDKTGVIARVTAFLFEQHATSRRWRNKSPAASSA